MFLLDLHLISLAYLSTYRYMIFFSSGVQKYFIKVSKYYYSHFPYCKTEAEGGQDQNFQKLVRKHFAVSMVKRFYLVSVTHEPFSKTENRMIVETG